MFLLCLFRVVVVSALFGVGLLAHAAPTAEQYRVMKDTCVREAKAMRGIMDAYEAHIEVWGDPASYGPFTNRLYNSLTKNLRRQAGLFLDSYRRVERENPADVFNIWVRNRFPKNGDAVPDVRYMEEIRGGNFARLRRDAISAAVRDNADMAPGRGGVYQGLYRALDDRIRDFHVRFSELVNRLVNLSTRTGGPGVGPADRIDRAEYDLMIVGRDVVRQHDRLAVMNRSFADGTIVNTGLDVDIVVPRFFEGLSLEEIKRISNGEFTFLNNAVSEAIRNYQRAAVVAAGREDPAPPILESWISGFYANIADFRQAERGLIDFFRENGTDVEGFADSLQSVYTELETRRSSSASAAVEDLDAVSEFHPALSDSLQIVSGVTRSALEEYSLYNTDAADYLVRRATLTSRNFTDLASGDVVRTIGSAVEKAYSELIETSEAVIYIGRGSRILSSDTMQLYNELQFTLYERHKKFQDMYSEYKEVSSDRAINWLEGKFDSASYGVVPEAFAEAELSSDFPADFSEERIARIVNDRQTVEARLREMSDIFDQMSSIKERYDPLFQRKVMLQLDGRNPSAGSNVALDNMKQNFAVLERRARNHDIVIQATRDSLYRQDTQGGAWLWDQTSGIEWPRLDRHVNFTVRGDRPPVLPEPVIRRPLEGVDSAESPGEPLPVADAVLPSRSEIDLSRLLDRGVTVVERSGRVKYSSLLDAQDSADREYVLRRLEYKFWSLVNAEKEIDVYYTNNEFDIRLNSSGIVARSYMEKTDAYNTLAQETEEDISTFLENYSDEPNFADLYDIGFGSVKIHHRYKPDESSEIPFLSRQSLDPLEHAVRPRPGSGKSPMEVQALRDVLHAKVEDTDTFIYDVIEKSFSILEVYTSRNVLDVSQINERVDSYNSSIRDIVVGRYELFIHMDELARNDANALNFLVHDGIYRSLVVRKYIPTVDDLLTDSYEVTLESILLEKSNAELPESFRLPVSSVGGSPDIDASSVGVIDSVFDGHWFGGLGDDISLNAEQLITKEFGNLFELIVDARTSVGINSRILESWQSDRDAGKQLNIVRQAWNEDRFKLEFVYRARLARLINHAMKDSPVFRDSEGGLDVVRLGGLLLGIVEQQPVDARAYLLGYSGFELAEPQWSGPVFRVGTGTREAMHVSEMKFGGITLQSEPLAMPEEGYVSSDIDRARKGYTRYRDLYIDAVGQKTDRSILQGQHYETIWPTSSLQGQHYDGTVVGSDLGEFLVTSGIVKSRIAVSTAANRYLSARRELFSLDPNGALWAWHVGNYSQLPPHVDVDEAIFAGRGVLAELATVEPDVATPGLLRIEELAVAGGSGEPLVRFELPRLEIMDRIRRSLEFAEDQMPADPDHFPGDDSHHRSGGDPPGAMSADYYSQVPARVGGHAATGGRADYPYAQGAGGRGAAVTGADMSELYSTPGSGGGRSGPQYHVLDLDDPADDSGSDSDSDDSGDLPYADVPDPPYLKTAVGVNQVPELGLDVQGREVDPVLGRRPSVSPGRSAHAFDLALELSIGARPDRGSSGGGDQVSGYDIGIEETLRALGATDSRVIAEHGSAALGRLIEAYSGSFYMRDGSATDLGSPRNTPEFDAMARAGYTKYLYNLRMPTWRDQSSALSRKFDRFVQFDQEVANSPPAAGEHAPHRFYAYSSPGSPRASWRASPRFGEGIGIGDTFVSADTMIVDNSPFGLARASAEVLRSGGGDGRLVVYEIINEDFGQFDKVAGARQGFRSVRGAKSRPTIDRDDLGGGVARSLSEKLSRLRAMKEGDGSSFKYMYEMNKNRNRAGSISWVFDLIKARMFGETDRPMDLALTEVEGIQLSVFGAAMTTQLAFVSVDKSGFTRGSAFEVVDIQELRPRFRFYRPPMEWDDSEAILTGVNALIGFDEPLEVTRVVLRPRRSVNSGEEVWLSRSRGEEGPRRVSVDAQWDDLDALGVKKGFEVQCD